MGFKRAEWKSGLTYEQTCKNCGVKITYMDDKLDFRPWFPDGFVYCPRCKTPLRHNENLAINRPEEVHISMLTPDAPKEEINMVPEAYALSGAPIPPATTTPPTSKVPIPMFCRHCGKQFREDDRFCSGCGAKRE